MKHVIVGTAGHIDHGKTALVKALTGIDADRLEEEKRRGITIDLGFAHLRLTSTLSLGFVDVPGHERFVKNMLAGVGGIDMVLFVVAADESIKPQTREHFDICRLLAVPRGVVALTKRDLVEPDILELVRLEVEELVAGSFLAGAPVVPVSSITGAGLDDLRAALAGVAATVPGRNAAGHFRLPIDRVFSVKGFGTVVTGTLISGSVAREQEVEVYPSGRRLRVRGVQVHGQAEARAVAGQRTAINLADIEPSSLSRGDVLSEPRRFGPSTQVDCRLHLLPSAKPLKHRAPVHFHAGTAEIEAEVRLYGAASLAPGASTCARLVLRRPALLLPGDRFIIRMFSPVATIGGGVVLDVRGLRYTRRDAPLACLEALEAADAAGRIATFVRQAPLGMGMDELVALTGLTDREVAAAAAKAPLIRLGEPQDWYVDQEWFAATQQRLVEAVRRFHADYPLLPGIGKVDLANRVSLGPSAPEGSEFGAGGRPAATKPNAGKIARATKEAPQLVDALLAAPSLAVEGETVRLRSHRVVLKQDEEQARAAIERAFEQAGLAVPSVAEVLAKSGVEPARARTLMQILLREKRLVPVGAELVFHQAALHQLRQMLAARKGERFAVPAFKEWTGISRKYAIPLLEYLDREHVTRREGDGRVVI